MTLADMHVMFRQYAQQMGMQNVRAILPEQIDIFLNNAISDTINEIIQQSVGLTNDRVVTDNSKLAQINALRSLYTVKDISLDSIVKNKKVNHYNYDAFEFDDSDLGINPLYYVDFNIDYNVGGKHSNYYPVRLVDDRYLSDVLNDFILAPTFRSPVLSIYNRELSV